MNMFYSRLLRRFDGLKGREKILVFVSALAVMIYLAFDWGILPKQDKLDRINTQLQSTALQASNAETQLASLKENLVTRVNPHTVRQEKLRNDIAELDNALSDYEYLFVSAQEMAELLHDILRSAETVTVKSLQSLDSIEVDIDLRTPAASSPATDATAKKNGDDPQKFYRHGIRLDIEGDFFSVVKYLKVLERLRWKLYWETLDYVVKEYPNANVSVELYRFSTESQWISV